MKRVLITGMSGLIGGLLRRHLEGLGGYELRALNRRPVQGVECFQADIADLEAIRPAFDGMDVVVHLAAQIPDEPWEGMLRTNLAGTYNVYEAARLAGAKRVVFASSGATVSGFELTSPYDAIAASRYVDVPADFPKVTSEMLRPNSTYAASKVWGETLGRYYADVHGLSVLCARIGSVRADDRPHETRQYAVYLSHRDVVQVFRRCIDAPDELRYDVFFATSNNRWGYRDLEHTRRVLGYEPQDSADAFIQ